MIIAVTGANGSAGVNLLGHIAEKDGVEAVGVVRSERAAAALPTLTGVSTRVVSFDDAAELSEAFEGASCVVHLAGILIEHATSTYESGNVASTMTAVEACRRAGVGHVILVSVLGARPDSKNRYFRSKGEAEQVVARSGTPATIIRTPILLGPSTSGAQALVRSARKGRVRLVGGGRHELRPLDVDDLSRAILDACATRAEGVSTHELAGPETVPYRELVLRTAAMMGRDVSIASLPKWMAKVGAGIASRLRDGGVSPTVIDVITTDEAVDSNADVSLGIELTPLSETLQKILPNSPRVT